MESSLGAARSLQAVVRQEMQTIPAEAWRESQTALDHLHEAMTARALANTATLVETLREQLDAGEATPGAGKEQRRQRLPVHHVIRPVTAAVKKDDDRAQVGGM